MCIRDRDNSFVFSVVRSYNLEIIRVKISLLDAQMAYGITSVSYTHLRAHETVLDLVCRLLLEKRNKQLLSQQVLALYFIVFLFITNQLYY